MGNRIIDRLFPLDRPEKAVNNPIDLNANLELIVTYCLKILPCSRLHFRKRDLFSQFGGRFEDQRATFVDKNSNHIESIFCVDGNAQRPYMADEGPRIGRWFTPPYRFKVNSGRNRYPRGFDSSRQRGSSTIILQHLFACNRK